VQESLEAASIVSAVDLRRVALNATGDYLEFELSQFKHSQMRSQGYIRRRGYSIEQHIRDDSPLKDNGRTKPQHIASIPYLHTLRSF
jgi:hypothetical protein